MSTALAAALQRFKEKRAFGTQQRAEFYADMGRFLAARIPPFQALERVHQVAVHRGRVGRAAILRRVLRRMSAGKLNVADALAPELPGREAVMLVGAAEAGSSVLAKAFSEIGALLDRQLLASRKLRKALFSSGVGLLAVVGVITMMVTVVVPQLQASVTPAMKPRMGFSLGYFAFSHYFLRVGPIVGVLFLALGGWAWWSLPRWHVPRPYWRRDWFDRHLLPWTFHLRTQSAFFLSTVSAMLSAGVPMREVLAGMQRHATPWMRSHLRAMLMDLRSGRGEVEALAASFLPDDTTDRLSIYSLIPDFNTVMARLSDDNFRVYEQKIKVLSTIMRAATLAVLATFIVATLFMVFDFSTALKASTHVTGM